MGSISGYTIERNVELGLGLGSASLGTYLLATAGTAALATGIGIIAIACAAVFFAAAAGSHGNLRAAEQREKETQDALLLAEQERQNEQTRRDQLKSALEIARLDGEIARIHTILDRRPKVANVDALEKELSGVKNQLAILYRTSWSCYCKQYKKP